jgi:hypothetical protein
MERLLIAAVIAGFSIIIMPSCGNEKKQENPVSKTEHYQCPMKCTQEIFDKPGACSSCGMDLEKISEL